MQTLRPTVIAIAATMAFCIMLYATMLSLTSNQDLAWFDLVSAAPMLWIIFSLAFRKSDAALIRGLDGMRAAIERILGSANRSG